MSSAAAPETDVHLPLKPEDGPSFELVETEFIELDQLRSAIDSTVARLLALQQTAGPAGRDVGFSCEWWPPD